MSRPNANNVKIRLGKRPVDIRVVNGPADCPAVTIAAEIIENGRRIGFNTKVRRKVYTFATGGGTSQQYIKLFGREITVKPVISFATGIQSGYMAEGIVNNPEEAAALRRISR